MKRRKIVISITLALGLTQNPVHAQFDPVFELSNINGQNGVVFNGQNTYDFAGSSISNAGDINGDGIDDVIIGAPGADQAGNSAGRSYVVFGKDTGLPNPLNLAGLDGSDGIIFNGAAANTSSGSSVSAAGDLNGDGIDDLIIGANNGDPNGSPNAGSSYVVFGSNLGFTSPFNLSSVNGTNGVVINGASAGDKSGGSVSAAGDFNGDGIDDIIIGAYEASPGGNSDAGASYVVFGSDTGLTHPLNLASLIGVNGFLIAGEAAGDYSGTSVSSAGDMNGDGIDDVIIGARGADPGGSDYAGRSYVVFGTTPENTPKLLALASLNGSNGFAINGEGTEDYSGSSVSAAGDINGDGFDDIIIGAPKALVDQSYNYNGSSYVIYGTDSGFTHPFNLSDLNGTNGFAMIGVADGDEFGIAVSAAGDLNGDGLDDLVIGAEGAGDDIGSAYVLFGSTNGFAHPFDTATLDGNNGFILNGVSSPHLTAGSVSSAGDVNDDGVDDLLLGARGLSFFIGGGYVVYGNDVIFKNGFD